jgi:uncharacterized membrane protein YqiK
MGVNMFIPIWVLVIIGLVIIKIVCDDYYIRNLRQRILILEYMLGIVDDDNYVRKQLPKDVKLPQKIIEDKGV